MAHTKKSVFRALLIICIVISSLFYLKNNTTHINISHAYSFKESFIATNVGIDYEFTYGDKKFKFNSNDFENNLTFEERIIKAKNFENIKTFVEQPIDAVIYAFPEMREILNNLQNAVFVNKVPERVFVKKNSCEIKFKEGESGRFLNLNKFAEDFEKEIERNFKNFECKTLPLFNTPICSSKKVVDPKIQTTNKPKNIKITLTLKTDSFGDNKNLKGKFLEKSCFSTSFSTSGVARKNNIKVALEAFDGIILEVGEILSFNNTTGARTAENGYMQAKIITDGTFVEGYGGGVCQVSTTLYNACLLAGLEIVEVNNHSLPVSYIEPSFDAMVNSGSSDLVICNNTSGKIVITTSSKNDICKVKIFGEKNKFKITRFSEKTKIIPAEPDEIKTDLSTCESLNLLVGEEKRLSYAKDGFCSNGYLNYYDENGVLVKTQKIRTNKYNPTRGIVVKREE